MMFIHNYCKFDIFMKKLNKYFNLIILLILGCAAVAPPSGGNADIDGPKLIGIYPDNNYNLKINETIIFEFNELINPKHLSKSIQVSSNANYIIKVKGRKILIEPKNKWPNFQLIHIKISQKLKDYQNNMMAKPINIIFSTGVDIPSGEISGTIIKYNNNLTELGLYKWPITDSTLIIQKVEADENGNYKFIGLEDGKYTIIAIEGTIGNISKQIQRKKYALITTDFIQISNNIHSSINLLLSEPIKKQKIISVEMLSQFSFNLVMDDNSKNLFVIDSSYSPGDSISINLEKSNRLEKYTLQKFSFILPKKQDSLGPILINSQFNNNNIKLIFSEQIITKPNAITINQDSLNVPALYNLENSNTIIISNSKKDITNINLRGKLISDWEGNFFSDSIFTIELPDKNIIKKNIGGNILGKINYNGKLPVIVEAINISNDSTYSVFAENNIFKLLNLPSGVYRLWAFEGLNNQNPKIYFSGLWEPFKRAARFSNYLDSIDVRSRWDIEGITINIH